ncbi:MAG: hypothetical protein CSA65_03565 [Proteobacteria bacterium]|nr:MAG: hypothetical protein CSB49_07185 [Pseudomonadota bacterium]PIE19003.1 MAG: hypothetical protein CSA65_03565 [Pseudomonadota bacterium]
MTRARLTLVALAGFVVGCGAGAQQLLDRGQYQEVLRRVRPVGALAYRLRSEAYIGLGKLAEARRALRLARALDPDDVRIVRLAARLELEAGAAGAALEALRRAFALSRRQPRRTRWLYASLLRRRATLRSDPARRIGDRVAAKTDLALAQRVAQKLGQKLAPSAAARVRAALRRIRRCGGPPAKLPLRQLTSPPRCTVDDAAQRLLRLRRLDLLVACAGAQTALALERAGCRHHALSVWRALRREQPSDGRWPLQVGRVLLGLRGRAGGARIAFEAHVFFATSAGRGRAALRVGEVERLAGRRRHAAAWAVKALSLSLCDADRLAALKLLARLGDVSLLREAARAARASSAALGPAIDGLLRSANAPRQRPGR